MSLLPKITKNCQYSPNASKKAKMTIKLSIKQNYPYKFGKNKIKRGSRGWPRWLVWGWPKYPLAIWGGQNIWVLSSLLQFLF